MNLYRIISLETFIDLLHNKRERYVRPACWDDTFEGYLFSKLYDEIEQKKIIEEMYYNVCPRNYVSTINNILNLEHSKYFVYGQCWSKEADSDALWRIYSYGEHSIQIESTEELLNRMLSRGNASKYIIGEVNYDVNTEEDLIHKQILQQKDSLSIYEPFLHKRKAFEHEKEVRVLIDDIRWNQMTKLSGMGATWNIDKDMDKLQTDEERIDEIEKRLRGYLNHWNENVIPDNFYIENINLNAYIMGVTVNPFAEPWYVELIESLCEKAEIKFNGKSGLYRSV
jgi:hypothetical protein